MITIKERNGLSINNPDEGEKTLFLDTDGKLKTKNENGLIEEVSIVSANTPKVYKALLTQTGTSAPIATVLENTLGEDPILSYGDVGEYYLTVSNITFDPNKVLITTGISSTDLSAGNIAAARVQNSTQILIIHLNTSTLSADNDNLEKVPIIIEVYP